MLKMVLKSNLLSVFVFYIVMNIIIMFFSPSISFTSVIISLLYTYFFISVILTLIKCRRKQSLLSHLIKSPREFKRGFTFNFLLNLIWLVGRWPGIYDGDVIFLINKLEEGIYVSPWLSWQFYYLWNFAIHQLKFPLIIPIIYISCTSLVIGYLFSNFQPNGKRAKSIFLLILIFFIVNPVTLNSTITVNRDVLFSWFYIGSFLCLFELFTKHSNKLTPRHFIAISLFSVGFLFIRQEGIFVYIILGICLWNMNLKDVIKQLAIYLLPIYLISLFIGEIYGTSKSLSVKKSVTYTNVLGYILKKRPQNSEKLTFIKNIYPIQEWIESYQEDIPLIFEKYSGNLKEDSSVQQFNDEAQSVIRINLDLFFENRNKVFWTSISGNEKTLLSHNSYHHCDNVICQRAKELINLPEFEINFLKHFTEDITEYTEIEFKSFFFNLYWSLLIIGLSLFSKRKSAIIFYLSLLLFSRTVLFYFMSPAVFFKYHLTLYIGGMVLLILWMSHFSKSNFHSWGSSSTGS